MQVREAEEKEREERRQRKLEKVTTLSIFKSLPPPMARLHMNTVVHGLFVVYLVFVAAVIKLLSPSLFWLVISALVFLPAGVAMSFFFRRNYIVKNEVKGQINIEPGIEGMTTLLHQVPTWLSFQETEKVQWINKILQQTWPFYDKAICNEIRTQVEPVLETSKPPFIHKMGFQKLTFGESPFQIDAIKMDSEADDRVEMEIDFRWHGDANIAFFIQLSGLAAVGGEATQMVVKLTKLQLSGTLKVIMTPFVDVIPGFGAVLLSLTNSPIIKYRLDFGKALGSSMSAGLVRQWLDPFIRNTLVEMLVWPERLLTPMAPEEVTGPLEHLKKRLKGILQVTILKARDIKAMDSNWGGAASDPFISMWSNPERRVETRVIKNTLAPEWEETFHILVQEPGTQKLKIELYDYDAVNIKELTGSINVFKNIRNMYGARELMGRVLVEMKPYSDRPGEEVEEEFDLGLQDWSSIGGPGKGEGKLTVRLMYAQIAACRGMDFKTGVVIVKLWEVTGLEGLELTSPMQVYVKFKMRDAHKKLESKTATLIPPKKNKKTGNVEMTNPSWGGKVFMFYEICKRDIMEVKVMEADSMSDENQGSCILSLEDVVIPKPNSTVTEQFLLEDTNLPPGRKAHVHLTLEWAGFIPEDEEAHEAVAHATPTTY